MCHSSSSQTEENADKLIRVATDGKIHADITGSAQGLGSVPIDLNQLEDGQILRYHESTNTFRNEDQTATVGVGKSLFLRDGVKFVKGEVIGIGDGREQTALLAHTDNLTAYKFALYFNGELQTSGFVFSPLTGQVTFTAPNDVIVSVDYF